MVAAPPPPTFAFGPVKVHGWTVEGQFGGRAREALVQLSRGRAKIDDLTAATLASVRRKAAFGEYHIYGLHGRRVQTSSREVVVQLGLDGGVALRFHPRGSPRTRPRPPRCTGTAMRVQPGRLAGSLTVITGLDGIPLLHLTSLPGARVVRLPRLKCHSASKRFTNIQPEQQGTGPDFEMDRTPTDADIAVTLYRDPQPNHPLQATHVLLGLLPPSALAVAADLSRATFTGTGPFAGTATFVSPRPGAHSAQGTLAGPLTANFAGLGPVPALSSPPIPAQLSTGSG